MHQGDPKRMHGVRVRVKVGYKWSYIGKYKRSEFNQINLIPDYQKQFKIVQKDKRKKFPNSLQYRNQADHLMLANSLNLIFTINLFLWLINPLFHLKPKHKF